MLLGEPGGEKVRAVLDGALLCAVNLAEIVSHYAKLGASRPDIEAMLRPLPIRVVPVDTALSYEARTLRPLTLLAGCRWVIDTAWRWPSARAFRL
jgi:PIN domain nuclease of toxin-antitoxin system